MRRFDRRWMVVEETLPRRRRIGQSLWHGLVDGGFTDIDAKFLEFAVDSRGSPQGICATHLPDQLSDLMTHCRSPRPTRPTLPRPVLSECGPMPGDHGLWLDDEQGIAPAVPDSAEHDPQPTLDWAKLRPSYGSLEHRRNKRPVPNRNVVKPRSVGQSRRGDRCGIWGIPPLEWFSDAPRIVSMRRAPTSSKRSGPSGRTGALGAMRCSGRRSSGRSGDAAIGPTAHAHSNCRSGWRGW